MTRVERYEQRTEIPLALLAVAFLVAYAWPVIDPRLDPDLVTVTTVVSWTVWVAFAVDLAVRLALAEDRGRYARRHWYDVALVVVPALRPLRLLRLLAVVRLVHRGAGRSLGTTAATYAAGSATMALVVGSVAVLDVEQEAPGANIVGYGDALWWAATTITTVGYGDHYPVTTAGRLIAGVLMLVGIALLGVVTAALAAWLVEATREDEDEVVGRE